jgi:nitroreductase
MNIMESITARRSVRSFLPEKVSPDLVTKLLEAARWAPTPGNLQFRRFVVIEDSEIIQKVAAATLNQPFLGTVPLVIAACTNPQAAQQALGDRGPMLAFMEAAAAMENILLAAHGEKLASCWVGLFDEQKVNRILACPVESTTVALAAIGHAAEIPPPPARLPVEAITCWRKNRQIK